MNWRKKLVFVAWLGSSWNVACQFLLSECRGDRFSFMQPELVGMLLLAWIFVEAVDRWI